MSGVIIYDMRVLALTEGELVLAALKGCTNSFVRGTLTRHWRPLATGTAEDLLEEACRQASNLETGSTEYKPKPAVGAEGFLSLLRKRIEQAAPFGEACPSEFGPRVSGFCIQVERDAMPQWKGEDLAAATRFLELDPDLRSPYATLVLEKKFHATYPGLLSWRSHRINTNYAKSFPVIKGRGEV